MILYIIAESASLIAPEPAQVLLTELARVRCHGFSEHELAAARNQQMAEVASSYRERDQVYGAVSMLSLKTRTVSALAQIQLSSDMSTRADNVSRCYVMFVCQGGLVSPCFGDYVTVLLSGRAKVNDTTRGGVLVAQCNISPASFTHTCGAHKGSVLLWHLWQRMICRSSGFSSAQPVYSNEFSF